MNNNLLIGGVTLIAIILFIYMLSQPKEVTAPVEEVATSTESVQVENDAPPVEGATPSSTGTPNTPVTTLSKVTFVETSTSQAQKAADLPYTAVVVYDGERFIPDKVTVILGGTVRFVNTSNEEMWIASDNHPTHTRYPVKSESDCKGSSFDQCVSVEGGGSWSFTFTRTGTWGYHNHTRAQDTGDVVVRTEEEYLKSR